MKQSFVALILLISLIHSGNIQAQQEQSRQYYADLMSNWGYISKSGDFIIKPKFYTGGSFSEGLAYVQTGNNRWDYIDKTGKKVISVRAYLVGSFSDGLARAHQSD